MALDCVAAGLVGWAPLFGLAIALFALRTIWAAPRMRRVGSPAPGIERIASLLVDGHYEGVPVREEDPGAGAARWAGGRYLPERREIRLGPAMLARGDVDALAILDHERGHAARDVPAPRAYRLALIGLFLAGLALAIANPERARLGTTVMGAAFAVAALHTLRNELAASEHALRRVAERSWPPALRREALGRLGASLGVYAADWLLMGSVVVVLIVLLRCRG